MSDYVRRVGVVGLGRMGSAIAHRILRAGYEVTVYNRTAEKARPLVAAGARVASTAREAAREAEVVVTSLTAAAAVRDVTEGADGILAGLAPGATHLGTSTISPGWATTLGALFAHPTLVEYATRIRARDFDTVGFDLRSGFKDITLMIQAAAAVQAPLPFAMSAHDRFVTALAQGLGDKDWSAIYEINRRNAGLT